MKQPNDEVVLAPKVRIFRNPSNALYLKALFFEEALEPARDYVLYTLKLEDHQGFPSIHRLFLEEDDPTEYLFAKKYFANWKHWKMVRECTWFKPHYEAMKEELMISIKARALIDLREARKNPKNAVQVNKYLIEGGWEDKTDKRGRPSKETIKREADKLFKESADVLDDYKRLELNG